MPPRAARPPVILSEAKDLLRLFLAAGLLFVCGALLGEDRPRIRDLGVRAPGKPVRQVEELENDFVSPLFLAAVEAVEEAVYNSLLKATTVTGNGHTVEAIPIDRLKEIFTANRRTPVPR